MNLQKISVNFNEEKVIELTSFSDLEIECKKDSKLILKLANFSNQENLKITANLGQNAKFDVVFADFSNANISLIAQVNLNENGASCNWHLATLSNKEFLKKFDVSFTHVVGHTNALMDNYGVARDNSQITFTGISHIKEHAVQSVTAQNAKIIVFDKSARGVASPILKIDENDVQASHGAVVGQLNEDHLFYLMSRGLSNQEARALITLGYLQPISKEFSEKIQDKIAKSIQEAM